MIKIKPGEYYNMKGRTTKFISSTKWQKFKSDFSEKHYYWVGRYLPETYEGKLIRSREMQKLIDLLCNSFSVPKPNIYIDPEISPPTARTLFLDGAVLFPPQITKGVVIHEFIHWYLWQKYRMVDIHNTSAMKSIEYQLVKLIVKNINLGKRIKHG